jgi:hypothetical protein
MRKVGRKSYTWAAGMWWRIQSRNGGGNQERKERLRDHRITERAESVPWPMWPRIKPM